MSQPLALTPTVLQSPPPPPVEPAPFIQVNPPLLMLHFIVPDSHSSPAHSQTDYVHQHYTGLFPTFSLSLITMGMKVALFQHTERRDD